MGAVGAIALAVFEENTNDSLMSYNYYLLFQKESLILANKDRLHPKFDFHKASPIDHLSSFLTNHRMGISGDSQKFEFFREKTSKISKVELIPIPVISPKLFWGFSGIKPKKKLKIKPTLVPKKSPKFFQTLSPSPPRPQNSGTGTGKIGDWGPVPPPYFKFIGTI